MRVNHTTSRNGSQMTNSSTIGVHETFRSAPSIPRLPAIHPASCRGGSESQCTLHLNPSAFYLPTRVIIVDKDENRRKKKNREKYGEASTYDGKENILLIGCTVTGENASQVAEIVNSFYGTDNVTANYVKFWFRRFRSDIFYVKDAPRTGRPVVENVDKITEIIEVDRHVSSRSIAQELKIDHKTVLRNLRKFGFKRKLHV
ncbi:histone-lysine N-methyltransferase SETMAR [Trichonephila clavipes]|nr:histone-lysine N-methyltransferase SETMAR [Trichonephila clavipes]